MIWAMRCNVCQLVGAKTMEMACVDIIRDESGSTKGLRAGFFLIFVWRKA